MKEKLKNGKIFYKGKKAEYFINKLDDILKLDNKKIEEVSNFSIESLENQVDNFFIYDDEQNNSVNNLDGYIIDSEEGLVIYEFNNNSVINTNNLTNLLTNLRNLFNFYINIKVDRNKLLIYLKGKGKRHIKQIEDFCDNFLKKNGLNFSKKEIIKNLTITNPDIRRLLNVTSKFNSNIQLNGLSYLQNIPGFKIGILKKTFVNKIINILENNKEKIFEYIIEKYLLPELEDILKNPEKKVIELFHIYANENVNEYFTNKLDHLLLNKAFKKFFNKFKNINFIFLIDNYTPCFLKGGNCEINKINALKEFIKTEFNETNIFLEGDEQLFYISEKIIATLKTNKFVFEENNKLYFIDEESEKKILLKDLETGKYSCAILDAAFSILKFLNLDAKYIINVLPFGSNNLLEDNNYLSQQKNVHTILNAVREQFKLENKFLISILYDVSIEGIKFKIRKFNL